MCVRGIGFVSISTIFLLDFDQRVSVCFVFVSISTIFLLDFDQRVSECFVFHCISMFQLLHQMIQRNG